MLLHWEKVEGEIFLFVERVESGDEMAVNVEFGDDDYIDMELSSSSSPQSREFDFRMAFSCCNEKEAMELSPADELFYKGKLLPLLLRPRRLMVQNLLFPAATSAGGDPSSALDISKLAFLEDDACYDFSMPLRSCSTAPGTNSLNTPVDSCNISPSESRRVSCELNPDDYFFEWSSEMSSFIRDDQHPILKKPWSKKLKLMKHSIFMQKLKASRAYLRSLFATKSGGGCSDEIASGNNPKEAQNSQKEDESYPKTSKKKSPYPAATISSILKNMDRNGGNVDDITHRRSFSGAIKRRPPAALCLSSSSSSSSSSCSSSVNASVGFQDTKQFFLRRSSSATEIENSIQAAIAHCKRSQQVLDSINKPEIVTS